MLHIYKYRLQNRNPSFRFFFGRNCFIFYFSWFVDLRCRDILLRDTVFLDPAKANPAFLLTFFYQKFHHDWAYDRRLDDIPTILEMSTIDFPRKDKTLFWARLDKHCIWFLVKEFIILKFKKGKQNRNKIWKHKFEQATTKIPCQ